MTNVQKQSLNKSNLIVYLTKNIDYKHINSVKRNFMKEFTSLLTVEKVFNLCGGISVFKTKDYLKKQPFVNIIIH